MPNKKKSGFFYCTPIMMIVVTIFLTQWFPQKKIDILVKILGPWTLNL